MSKYGKLQAKGPHAALFKEEQPGIVFIIGLVFLLLKEIQTLSK